MSEVEKKRVRDEGVDEVAEKKKHKKNKEKKEKKNTKDDEDEVTEAVVEVDDADEEKKKSKKKKDKKEKRERDEAVSGEVDLSSSSSNGANMYKIHPSTSAMTNDEVETFRAELGIAVIPSEEGDAYKPMTSFDCLNPSLQGLCPYVQQYLREKNFTKPSPIQAQCWPPLLAGRDVIGIAQTGSGKTLTFLIPVLLKLAHLRAINGASSSGRVKGTPKPKVLIIAPTRELAMQSHQVVVEVNGPKSVCIYGGVPKGPQRTDLNAGAEIVVATPGRLVDLLEENCLSLSDICYMVLDEADRMLDDGFEPVIRQILSQCPKAGPGLADRQTVMFSATWPEEIRALADKFLRKDVVRITVGSDELSANHRVTQIVECVESYEKDKKLFALLEQYHKSRKNRVLVFVLYKREAVELQNKLLARGFNVTGIHGDKSQGDRTAALEEFKSGKTPLLIATDVAARGLDIPQVEYVINYSFPLTVEDYVHRIGRTGRGGASGISHTFFTDFDKGLAGALVAVLQEAKQEIPQDIYKYQLITKKKTSKLYGDFGPKAELAGKKATKITFD